ncbi:hypothetical protein SASPL_134293 [Salvia splendens]|uniref:Uncharacterized protein n=1 Tax=Salvia splendens TaxID=180675 RepID=A0A8X8X5T5_SALSN|nr:hypothetical protein SASPL_134293 [Salvia splendens]
MNPSGNSNNNHTMHPSVEAAINSELAAVLQRQQELANVEAQLEREKQRRRELVIIVPPLQMDEVSYEQLEQMRNSVMMFKHGAEVKPNGGASSLAAAGVKASPP